MQAESSKFASVLFDQRLFLQHGLELIGTPSDGILHRSDCYSLGNVHKGRPTIMGHFGHTYLPMSYIFYTMPITLV